MLIWRKQHESMALSCLVSAVQVGGSGVMLWGMFSWHTLGLEIQGTLNQHGYQSILQRNIIPSGLHLRWTSKRKVSCSNPRGDKVQICHSAPEQAVNPLFLGRH
uniref:Uncharacterized protein n=1 Tax=Oncorhynchus mykiss TaxID=8022 RepID=A0A8L0DNQ3_ONCMY